jgi:hypothetical protein
MPLLLKSTLFTGLPADRMHSVTGSVDLSRVYCLPLPTPPRVYCRTLIDSEQVLSRNAGRRFFRGIIRFRYFEDDLKVFEASQAQEESPYPELVSEASADSKLEISPLLLSEDTLGGDLYVEGAKQYARP